MRILHIDAGRRMRGGQWQVLYLAEGLTLAGHDVRLLAPAGSPLLEAARSRGLAAESLSLPTLWRRTRAAEVVHAHDAHAHTLGALLAARKLVVARRVAFPIKSGPLSACKYRRARMYLAVSEHVKASLLAAGLPSTRIRVVFDGVPLLPLSTRSGPIIAPATGDPLKGESLIAEAARLGGLTIRLAQEFERELRDASALVYLTQQEGLGSAVLMAMSAGVPVVASRIGGLIEIVRDGETGLLVENTAREVAEAVNRLRADGSLAARLAAAGRRQIEERFSLDALVRRTLEVYQEVLS